MSDKIKFYPILRDHISPSALDNWHHSRSAFIKTYFENATRFENASTRAGRKVHKLIEAGFLETKKVYSEREKELRIEIGKTGAHMLGYPDAYEVTGEEEATFVDYKTGKKNEWNDTELAVDYKMLATAWLVWKKTQKPARVIGEIEYIPVEWNEETGEIQPTKEQSEHVATFVYTKKELEQFESFIEKTIAEVNEEYPKFLESTEEFIDPEDLKRCWELNMYMQDLDDEMKLVKDRIAAQMKQGYKSTISNELGSFYFTTKRTFAYPSDLKVIIGKKSYTLEEVEKIASWSKVAKTKFEMYHEPTSVSRSLSFKAKKEKK